MIDVDLRAVAESLGVFTSYRDVAGQLHEASDAAVRAVCAMLAPEAEPAPIAGGAIDDVVVVRGDRIVSGVPLDFDGPLDVAVVLEDGTVLPSSRVDGSAALDMAHLPIGMHELRWRPADGAERQSALLVAPPHFSRPMRRRPGRTVFAPAYSLWDRDEPWPSYDNLGRLGRAVAPLGIDTIATLPLYSPGSVDRFESSPYSPLSRFHWNELLIPDRLLGAPATVPGEPSMPADRVRWSDVEAARWSQLAARAETLGSSDRDALDRFLAGRPDVVSYAAYAAAGDRPRARLHELGQWLAERALDDLLAELDRRGQRLALDLPVGARTDSWETATWPHLFCGGASIGAPPDTFFAAGQNWGLPPLIPTASRREGHRVWRDLLATACRYARVVRIDHVMQVYRLWWIPEGHAADDGVYVRYPADELLAVAAIVAEQTGTTMVGENLGTVPADVSTLLDDWRLIGMHEEIMALHEVESRPDGPPAALPPVPVGTWAGIRTHDMPALAATAAEVPTERYRWALSAELGHPVGEGPAGLMAAMVERLMASAAVDVVVDLDDALGATLPHNVPGVVDDLNWTRRTTVAVSELGDLPALAGVFGSHAGKADSP